MPKTLYSQILNLEETAENLSSIAPSVQIDVENLQRALFRKYEKNPVLYDDITGKQTIEKSLDELAQVNKGIRKLLPHRQNKAHNERLEQLGELVTEPRGLHTYGILMPENFITAQLEFSGLTFLGFYLYSKAISPIFSASPEMVYQTQILIPAFMCLTLVPIMCFGISSDRFERLPRQEAQYLDAKVKELYK
jgi:hypothetical protein